MTTPTATATDYFTAMTDTIARAERDATFCRSCGKDAQIRDDATAATDWYRRAGEHDIVAAAMRDAIAFAQGVA